MSSLKNIAEDSPTFLPQSPQGLAIRDPGVMSSSQSFTEIEFENRHTVDIGIGRFCTSCINHQCLLVANLPKMMPN